MEVHNNIFYRNEASESGGGLHCRSGTSGTVNACNAYWENLPSDMADCSDQTNLVLADPLFCNPAAEDCHLRDDSPCAPLNNPTCGRIGAFDVGCLAASTDDAGPTSAPQLIAGPNPFAQALVMYASAARPRGRDLALQIYSAGGCRIWSCKVRSAEMPILWDGRDSRGRSTPSGIYFIRLIQDGLELARRTVIRLE